MFLLQKREDLLSNSQPILTIWQYSTACVLWHGTVLCSVVVGEHTIHSSRNNAVSSDLLQKDLKIKLQEISMFLKVAKVSVK